MNYVTVKTFKMKFTLAVITLVVISCGAEDSDTYLSRFIADMWLEGTGIMKIIWKDCSKKLVAVKDDVDHKEYYPKFIKCMKRKTLRALDRSLSPDVVPIADGVNLVRFEIVDQSGNVIQENDTSTWSEKELDEVDWRDLAIHRIARVLKTHVIKFDFADNKFIDKVEFRGRRRHHMMTMMMFGIVSIGMVLIPMGFQFLAVLGGKALLLAKMALILASIQGLKKVDGYDGYRERGKIATSPISYGFYHYPPYEHFDKRSRYDWHGNDVQTNLLDRKGSISEDSDRKIDKFDIVEPKNNEQMLEVKEIDKKSRQYPLYLQPLETPVINQVNFSPIDAPVIADLTSRPGDVQADYTLDLPYNGFHFQSPTPVVSA